MGRKRARPGSDGDEDEDPDFEPQSDAEDTDGDVDVDDEDGSLDEEGEEELEDESATESDGEESLSRKGARPKSHVCKECGKAYDKPAKLAIHMRSHTGEKPFKCPVPGCDQAYVRRDHLERHLNSVTHLNDWQPGEERKMFKCDVPGCDHAYFNESHLTEHKNAHARAEAAPRNFVCDTPGCGAAFVKKTQLRQHQIVEHGAAPRYQCDTCGKGFPTAAKLTRHNATHEARLCPEPGCGVTLATYSELRKHLAHHRKKAKTAAAVVVSKPVSERKNILCTHPDCDKAFTSRKNMRAHRRACHEEVRFVCPYRSCEGKAFMHNCTLKKHIAREHPNGEEKKDPVDPVVMRKKQVNHLLTLDESTAEYRDLFLDTLMGGPVEPSEPPAQATSTSAQGQARDGAAEAPRPQEGVGIGGVGPVLPDVATGINVSA